MITLDLKPGNRQLHVFGVAALVMFGLLGWWLHSKGHPSWAMAAWIVAGISGAAAFLWPKANLPLYLTLSIVAFPIGLVLSYLVLGLMWYVIITLVALIFRLLGKDPLQRRFDRAAPTYWQAYPRREDRDSYFRQF
jgi:hypothetical protein